eukprot:scaffold2734_cov350-Prasinococcus_capsulatus_cf.AAC.6
MRAEDTYTTVWKHFESNLGVGDEVLINRNGKTYVREGTSGDPQSCPGLTCPSPIRVLETLPVKAVPTASADANGGANGDPNGCSRPVLLDLNSEPPVALAAAASADAAQQPLVVNPASNKSGSENEPHYRIKWPNKSLRCIGLEDGNETVEPLSALGKKISPFSRNLVRLWLREVAQPVCTSQA